MGTDGTPQRSISAVAQRMRSYRRRRRRGLHLVHVAITQKEIETLVRKGYLEDQQRSDPVAIQGAANEAFSDALEAMGSDALRHG